MSDLRLFRIHDNIASEYVTGKTHRGRIDFAGTGRKQSPYRMIYVGL